MLPKKRMCSRFEKLFMSSKMIFKVPNIPRANLFLGIAIIREVPQVISHVNCTFKTGDNTKLNDGSVFSVENHRPF